MKTVIGYSASEGKALNLLPNESRIYSCVAIEGFVPGDWMRAAMLTLALVKRDAMQDFFVRLARQFDEHLFAAEKKKIADHLPENETHRVYLLESIPTDDGAEMLDWRAYDSNVMNHAGVSSSHWPSNVGSTDINHASAVGVPIKIANIAGFWQLIVDGHEITCNDFHVAVDVSRTAVHYYNRKQYPQETYYYFQQWLNAISFNQ